MRLVTVVEAYVTMGRYCIGIHYLERGFIKIIKPE